MGIEPTELTQVLLGALASNVAGYPFLFAARHAYIKGFGQNPLKFNGVLARLCVVEASYLGFQAVMQTLDYMFSEKQEKKLMCVGGSLMYVYNEDMLCVG